MSKHLKQKGFTIIELLIATAVFSTVLLLASNAVVQIGRLYYKGLTSTSTQEAARAVSEDVAKAVQLSKKGDFNRSEDEGKAWDVQRSACVGDSRYTYVLNKQIGKDTMHALWVDQTPENGDCTEVDLSQLNPSVGGRELLGANMRLLYFDLDQLTASGVYRVNIKVAYGDNDLLTHYNATGSEMIDLNGNGSIGYEDAREGLCKSGIVGSNFCAVSALDTVVKRRIN